MWNAWVRGCGWQAEQQFAGGAEGREGEGRRCGGTIDRRGQEPIAVYNDETISRTIVKSHFMIIRLQRR